GKLKKKDWIALSAKYDIFINTSNIDNTPVSVIEAMALDLPVVSSNVGGIPFLIAHDKSGLLVPPDDPEKMAIAVTNLIDNHNYAGEIAMEARRVSTSYNWDVIKSLWNKVLV